MNIELRALAVPKIILQMINECHESDRKINYIFDKIRFIDSITTSVNTEISIILEVIKVIKKLIMKDFKLNVFGSCNNPLRLYIFIIKMIRTLKANSTNMSTDLTSLEEEVENLILEVIEHVDNKGTLKNWLFDDFEEGLKVVDYIRIFNLLRPLMGTKLTKPVEQIWTGNYDQRINASILASLKTSELGVKFRSFNITLDKFITIVGLRN